MRYLDLGEPVSVIDPPDPDAPGSEDEEDQMRREAGPVRARGYDPVPARGPVRYDDLVLRPGDAGFDRPVEIPRPRAADDPQGLRDYLTNRGYLEPPPQAVPYESHPYLSEHGMDTRFGPKDAAPEAAPGAHSYEPPAVPYTTGGPAPLQASEDSGEAAGAANGSGNGPAPGRVTDTAHTDQTPAKPAETALPYLSDHEMDLQYGAKGPGAPGPTQRATPYALPESAYTTAQNAREALLRSRPVLNNPKWWQRVAAGALGGLAGWSNAASRTKNPIDIAGTSEAILHPGYQDKLAQWQSRMLPAEAIADIEGQKVASQQKARQIQSEEELKRSQSTAAVAHAQYWLHRAETEANHFDKVRGPHGEIIVIDKQTGEIKQGAPTTRDRYDEAIALGTSPEDARFYALNGKMPDHAARQTTEWQSYLDEAGGDSSKALARKRADEINRAKESRAPRDPTMDEYRQEKMEESRKRVLDGIGNRYTTQNNAILQRRQAELNRFGTGAHLADATPAEIQEINSRYARELQANQDEYARQGRERNVETQDFDVNPQTLEYSPRKTQAQPPTTAAAKPSLLALDAYAKKYFGGDMKKAQSAIDLKNYADRYFDGDMDKARAAINTQNTQRKR